MHSTTANSVEYTIEEAKYAQNKMIIKCKSKADTDTSYFSTTRAMRLAEHVGGRYTHRCGGYIVSKRQAKTFEDLYKAGRDASAFTGELREIKQ